MLPARPPPPPQQPGAPEAAAHRRPKAPHKSPRCARRRDTESGGEGRRSALPRRRPAPGREAARAARGQRFEGRPALTMGCGNYLIKQISPTKGAWRRDTASVPPAAHARRRGERRGKRGLEGPPCSVRFPPGGGLGAACPRPRRLEQRCQPAAGSLPRSSLRKKKGGCCPARWPSWGPALLRGWLYPPHGCWGARARGSCQGTDFATPPPGLELRCGS